MGVNVKIRSLLNVMQIIVKRGKPDLFGHIHVCVLQDGLLMDNLVV